VHVLLFDPLLSIITFTGVQCTWKKRTPW